MTKLVNKVKLQLLNMASIKVLTQTLQCVWFGMGVFFSRHALMHIFYVSYLSPAGSELSVSNTTSGLNLCHSLDEKWQINENKMG